MRKYSERLNLKKPEGIGKTIYATEDFHSTT